MNSEFEKSKLKNYKSLESLPESQNNKMIIEFGSKNADNDKKGSFQKDYLFFDNWKKEKLHSIGKIFFMNISKTTS